MSVPRSVVVVIIRFYQRWISPAFGQRCRYYPSSSVLRGLVLAGWRLLRCNPWSRGGFDPIDNLRLFRPKAPVPTS
jgi:uncharacterized protein